VIGKEKKERERAEEGANERANEGERANDRFLRIGQF
jgi:hypothetical protein